ncbi:MAG: ferredoxin--NADP reductase [Pseudomonadota bacterium]
MPAFYSEEVLDVTHWTDHLFSFRTTRNAGFRFASGQFAMIGLEISGKPLLRAYSMASANWEDQLGFYSIKVPGGPLTSRLQCIRSGDWILVSRKPTGTLLLDHLAPTGTLLLLCTGTGIAPFVSILHDPETYDRFQRVVLVHGCRTVAELAYGKSTVASLRADPIFADLVNRLTYHPTVTREPFRNRGRVTEIAKSGALGPLTPDTVRVMVCGSPEMLRESREMLEARGFTEGSGNGPGTYVIEKAFAEQ